MVPDTPHLTGAAHEKEIVSMNREIKFRAWDKNENTMRTHFDGWSDEVDVLSEVFPIIRDFGYELMQFTGQKDDNDVDVFEGDILNQTSGIWAVEWNDDKCYFQTSDGVPLNDGKNYGVSRTVIGNIYEHPELIK